MIVLFGHQKGGVGKSTIAINTAYQMHKKFKKLVLLDLDSQNSAMLFNQLRSSEDLHTITCIRENERDFDELVKEFGKSKDNLLIIDSGGYDSSNNRAALVKADIIITPLSISQIEIFGLQKFRKILKDASQALDKTVKTNVLINNVDSRSKNKLKELREYISDNNKYFDLLNTTVHSRADFKNSYGEGLTVKEFNKKGAAHNEIKELSKEIYKLINN